MGARTGIAWTDSTFNPWIGCTKIGPGCDFCYAEVLDNRFGGGHWGVDAPRRRTTAEYWKKPLAWNREAAAAGKPRLVFCASQADVFDNEVGAYWRYDLWQLIAATPHLIWQIVTKRIGNAPKMLPPYWYHGYPNVCLISTICNQEEAERDIPKLLKTPARWRGISYEPALGRVNWSPWLTGSRRLDWIIWGGESGSKARIFDLEWAWQTVLQCGAAAVPVFGKQLGSNPLEAGMFPLPAIGNAGKWDDPALWPERLRLRQFPKGWRT